MQSIAPTTAERNRSANAAVLIARHLTDRPARHIHAIQVEARLVWKVRSQTVADTVYTVVRQADGWEFDGCDCQDSCYRHAKGGCKHLRAVNELAPVAPVQPAPVAKPRKVRYEREEEI